MNSSYDSSSAKPLYRGTQVVWYLLYLIEVLLVFRFFLKLTEANSIAGFTRFVYDYSHPLVSPFLNVFGISSSEGRIFEWPTLLAMFVYWIIAYALIKLILMGQPVTNQEAKDRLENQDK
jgi:hypothetical protein